MHFFQGGYDGTHFLANVEVYDPVKEIWEEGIPLSSGRSGLASAVIYQPSCPQNYTQDCFANLSTNREYDDDKKPPDGHDDDAHQGAGSSYHLNCSSNFFNGRLTSSQLDDIELNGCQNVHNRISGELTTVMHEIKIKLKEHSLEKQLNDQSFQEQTNKLQVVKPAKFHTNCRKHQVCPLQILKRRFRNFIFNNKNRILCEKCCKSKPMWSECCCITDCQEAILKSTQLKTKLSFQKLNNIL